MTLPVKRSSTSSPPASPSTGLYGALTGLALSGSVNPANLNDAFKMVSQTVKSAR